MLLTIEKDIPIASNLLHPADWYTTVIDVFLEALWADDNFKKTVDRKIFDQLAPVSVTLLLCAFYQ